MIYGDFHLNFIEQLTPDFLHGTGIGADIPGGITSHPPLTAFPVEFVEAPVLFERKGIYCAFLASTHAQSRGGPRCSSVTWYGLHSPFVQVLSSDEKVHNWLCRRAIRALLLLLLSGLWHVRLPGTSPARPMEATGSWHLLSLRIILKPNPMSSVSQRLTTKR
jgi:hypothetical protein